MRSAGVGRAAVIGWRLQYFSSFPGKRVYKLIHDSSGDFIGFPIPLSMSH